jgi:GGDEF domain-containing protein
MIRDQELQDLFRSIRALARRADVAARKLEKHRAVSVPNNNATGVVGLAQIARAAKEFHDSIEGALVTLSAELRKTLEVGAAHHSDHGGSK